jgi:hypothetical protein
MVVWNTVAVPVQKYRTTNKNNGHRDSNPGTEYPADDHLHVCVFKLVHS